MNWIKLNNSIFRHPKVVTLASRLSVTPVTVVGALCHAWVTADEHADENGRVEPMDPETFDALNQLKGLAETMEKVGWLKIGDGWVEFPNYLEHNGTTAKERALAAARKRRSRAKEKAEQESVTPVTVDRDTCVTREEKRREEDSTTTTPRAKIEENVERVLAAAGIKRSAAQLSPDELEDFRCRPFMHESAAVDDIIRALPTHLAARQNRSGYTVRFLLRDLADLADGSTFESRNRNGRHPAKGTLSTGDQGDSERYARDAAELDSDEPLR